MPLLPAGNEGAVGFRYGDRFDAVERHERTTSTYLPNSLRELKAYQRSSNVLPRCREIQCHKGQRRATDREALLE